MVAAKYYVKFDTDSQPHIMCAPVLKVTDVKPTSDAGRVQLTLHKMDGGIYCKRVQVDLNGAVYPNSMIILVCTDKWDEPYIIAMRWTENGWVPTGDGKLRKDIDEDGIRQLPHRHFIVGTGSQTVVPTWPCDHGLGAKISAKALPLSYGVLLLKDHRVESGRELNKIEWFGKRVSNTFIFHLSQVLCPDEVSCVGRATSSGTVAGIQHLYLWKTTTQ